MLCVCLHPIKITVYLTLFALSVVVNKYAEYPITTILHCLKKQDTKLLPITTPNVNRFSKFFHL